MSVINLRQPFTEKGIHTINYFNGRLLTAEDLRADQKANREQHQQLGRALGEGVAYGLFVEPGGSFTEVNVTPGLAVNRMGQALMLPAPGVTIGLTNESQIVNIRAGLFGECESGRVGSIAVQTGIYVLTISAASGYSADSALTSSTVSSANGGGAANPGCGSRYAVEGVQFNMVRLPLSGPLADRLDTLLFDPRAAANLSQARSLLAHACFGSAEWLTLGANAYSRLRSGVALEAFGPLAQLRADGGLTACEVPLAVLAWTDAGIVLLDNWSVRRRMSLVAEEKGWPVPLRSRQLALREAMLLQFQEHAALLALTDRLRVEDYFAYLPAAGLLPAAPNGIDPRTFFGTRMRGHAEILPEHTWRALLEASLDYEPISLSSAGSATRIHVYSVAQNLAAPAAAQRYVLFASEALAGQFRVPVSIRYGGTSLDGDSLAALFKETYERYESFARLIISQVFARTVPTVLDHLGLAAIQQVIALARGLEARIRGLNQIEALAAFTGLADVQQQFTDTYLNQVLREAADAQRYGPSFVQVLTLVKDQISSAAIGRAIPALSNALRDSDLIAARTAQRAINQLLEFQVGGVPRGRVVVTFDESQTILLREDQSANLRFMVTVRANMDERYELVPVLVAEKAQEAWDRAVEFFTSELTPITDRRIELDRDGERAVFMRIARVPRETQGSKVRIKLIVRSTRNPSGPDALVGMSGEKEFTVGQEERPNESGIELTDGGFLGNARQDPATGRLLISQTDGAIMLVNAKFAFPSSYTVRAALANADGWEFRLLSPDTLPPGSRDATIRVGARPTRATAPNTDLVITVTDPQVAGRTNQFRKAIGVG